VTVFLRASRPPPSAPVPPLHFFFSSPRNNALEVSMLLFLWILVFSPPFFRSIHPDGALDVWFFAANFHTFWSFCFVLFPTASVPFVTPSFCFFFQLSAFIKFSSLVFFFFHGIAPLRVTPKLFFFVLLKKQPWVFLKTLVGFFLVISITSYLSSLFPFISPPMIFLFSLFLLVSGTSVTPYSVPPSCPLCLRCSLKIFSSPFQFLQKKK